MREPIRDTARTSPRPRTVVHAGPLLLREHRGGHALERYLARADAQDICLVHRGEPALEQAAREAAVRDIPLEQGSALPDAEQAAELAMALDADQLEFAIDRPSLQTPTGAPIQSLTRQEAELYLRDRRWRVEIRKKVRAACSALRRGLERVRIGSPTALQRDRATVIVPDSPFVIGGALLPNESLRFDGDSPAPDRDSEPQPVEFPEDERPHPIPAVARTRTATSGARSTPDDGCDIGPLMDSPFPPALRHLRGLRLPWARRERLRQPA